MDTQGRANGQIDSWSAPASNSPHSCFAFAVRSHSWPAKPCNTRPRQPEASGLRQTSNGCFLRCIDRAFLKQKMRSFVKLSSVRSALSPRLDRDRAAIDLCIEMPRTCPLLPLRNTREYSYHSYSSKESYYFLSVLPH
ncbi:hypothetical protein LIA77_01323 [Sarocladium implicatum]|nr:hypothetical protein LIA77_01323 [Sarocladium implicatum]